MTLPSICLLKLSSIGVIFIFEHFFKIFGITFIFKKNGIIQREYAFYIPYSTPSGTPDYIFMTKYLLTRHKFSQLISGFKNVIFRFDHGREFMSKSWLHFLFVYLPKIFKHVMKWTAIPFFHNHSWSDTDRIFGLIKRILLKACENTCVRNWVQLIKVLLKYMKSKPSGKFANASIYHGKLLPKQLKEQYLNLPSWFTDLIGFWVLKIIDGNKSHFRGKIWPQKDDQDWFSFDVNKLNKERTRRRKEGKKDKLGKEREVIVVDPDEFDKLPISSKEFLLELEKERLKLRKSKYKISELSNNMEEDYPISEKKTEQRQTSFFEKQTPGGLFCLQHALNNLFGMPVADQRSLDENARETARHLGTAATEMEMYDPLTGFYDRFVGFRWLTLFGMNTTPYSLEQISNNEVPVNNQFRGFLIQLTNPLHYISIRYDSVNQIYIYCDSLEDAPILGDLEFVISYMKKRYRGSRYLFWGINDVPTDDLQTYANDFFGGMIFQRDH